MRLFRDRLTPLAERRAHERLAFGYIVEARRGRLREVIDAVTPFDLFGRFVRRKLLRTVGEFQPLVRPIRVLPKFEYVTAFLPREAVFHLAEDPNVKRIFPDQLMWAFQFPTVPPRGVFEIATRVKPALRFTSTRWTRGIMGADVANEKGFYGRGVLVSVIDTGTSRTHEQTRRAVFETVLPAQRIDENGHGTWCASCIGGVKAVDDMISRRILRSVECEGLAPRCGLLAIKALGYVIGCGTESGILEALHNSLERGADVVSMSLGGPCEVADPRDDPYYKALDILIAEKVIPVIAMGNSGPSPETGGSPGIMPQALTIGAYDPITGGLARFSSRGPTPWGAIKPDCVAPGVVTHSATVGMLDYAVDHRETRYSPLSGTSMATPHVAGLVTLMKECHRDALGRVLTVEEVKDMLNKLGEPKNNDSGWGLLDWEMYERWVSTEYGVTL